MYIISSKNMLLKAQRQSYAVPAFNIHGDAFNAGLGEIAAQPQQVSQEAVKTKRSWLSRIFS